MPELPEVEAYRRLAEGAVGRTVGSVVVGDARFVRGGTEPAVLADAVAGRTVVAARRRGKLLVLDLGAAPAPVPAQAVPAADSASPAGVGCRLGLRFGMTGRLLLDGSGPVQQLLYSSNRADPRWDRFGIRFVDGGLLVVRDPRLLGGVVLDPDEDALGPDAATIAASTLASILRGRTSPLKAVLLHQGLVAGIGNLMADELLWQAGLAPVRPAGSLDSSEVARLHRCLSGTIRTLVSRGGSHTGDLMPARVPGGCCPRDGAGLVRGTVGGRTTWWCPEHQR